MSSTRLPVLVILTTVLLAACYAGREAVWMAAAVVAAAVVAAGLRPVLAVPVSVGAAATFVHAPPSGAFLAGIGVAVLFLVWVAVKLPDVAGMPADSR